jgi:hypothetical protein
VQKSIQKFNETELRAYWDWAVCCKYVAAVLAIYLLMLLGFASFALDRSAGHGVDKHRDQTLTPATRPSITRTACPYRFVKLVLAL